MKKLVILLILLTSCIMLPTAGLLIPPIPPFPTPPPPQTTEPSSKGSTPSEAGAQRFQIISREPILEGCAGSVMEYALKATQQGYPDLEVHLSAEVPTKWSAYFSENDFILEAEQSVELKVSLALPGTVTSEKFEIQIQAVGKSIEEPLEVEASLILTAVTYLIDVGVVNFQIQPPRPIIGEYVVITATVVNYTQRHTPDILVEFLIDSALMSRQVIELSGGVSQPIMCGWTAQPNSNEVVVKVSAEGDSNHRNDSLKFEITVESDKRQIDALYQQALLLYARGDYEQAQTMFATVAGGYIEIGEAGLAVEAKGLEERCVSYVQAQILMNQGEQAFEFEDYEQSAFSFEQARDIYSRIGDTERQNHAQRRLDAALAAQEWWQKYLFAGIVIGAVAVIIIIVKRH